MASGMRSVSGSMGVNGNARRARMKPSRTAAARSRACDHHDGFHGQILYVRSVVVSASWIVPYAPLGELLLASAG